MSGVLISIWPLGASGDASGQVDELERLATSASGGASGQSSWLASWPLGASGQHKWESKLATRCKWTTQVGNQVGH